MGLSGPKQKQRLVGSATTRNTAWLNDASAPGQRMLAQMGWSSGQSLGLTMPGLTENLKVAYKMDNKGIGAQRHEREARANGKDIWVGGGGDLGSLFERLNAANAASSSSSAVASSSSSSSAAGADDEEKKSKKSKKDKKEKKNKSSGEKSKKKRKHDDSDDASEEKSKKSKKDKREKKKKSESKKSKRSLEKQKAEAVAAVASADCALAKDEAAVEEIKKDIVQGRPVRLAHRAKFLRAKRMVSANDLASVNEILGIASTPSSSAAGTPKATSGTSTPTLAAPKTYPGPGGSEIPLMDVDRRLQAEQDTQSDSDSSDDDKKRKIKKEKREKKEREKKEKKDKKDKKKKSSSAEEAATPKDETAAAAAAAAAATVAAATAEEKEKSTQIGTNSQGLFVFEYLNRRLMIRKAQIAKQKKAEQQAIFARAARVGA